MAVDETFCRGEGGVHSMISRDELPQVSTRIRLPKRRVTPRRRVKLSRRSQVFRVTSQRSRDIRPARKLLPPGNAPRVTAVSRDCAAARHLGMPRAGPRTGRGLRLRDATSPGTPSSTLGSPSGT